MTNEITISTNESDMRSMLIKLMGRGMTLSQTVEGQFLLTLNDVLDLINKIVQRVQLQNHTKMSDFHAQFGFEDGSQETVPSYESLERYRSVNPNICNACSISFAFLIDFNTRGVEKQSIDIKILGKRGRDDEDGKSLILNDNIIVGKLDIRIEYTDVTWANDIKNLFEKYCDANVNKFRFRHKIVPLLGMRSFPFLFLPFVMITTIVIEARSKYDRIVDKLGDYLKGISPSDHTALILRKLDVLVYRENEIRSFSDVINTVVVMAAFLAAIIFLSALTKNIPISALVVSPESQKVYDRIEGKRKRLNSFFLGGIFLAVVVSLVSANLDRLLLKVFD